jgi:hypothetical protein
MQQLSGSEGLGGIHTPATKTLFFFISLLRSRGEESREEKRIFGPESVSAGMVDIGGFEEVVASVGGLLDIVGEEYSRREA